MNFLTPSDTVEKPCKDPLTYPLQCFQDLFLATPEVVGTFLLSVGGFVVALLIWGTIFLSALYMIFFVLKNLCGGVKYFFQQTRAGQKVVSLIPCRAYMQRFCCKAKEKEAEEEAPTTTPVPEGPKKLRAIGDYGAHIVSKVHVDSKWFKALRHITFGRALQQASIEQTPTDQEPAAAESPSKSPSKTPQRSTSRVSALTPKLSSPKPQKEQQS